MSALEAVGGAAYLALAAGRRARASRTSGTGAGSSRRRPSSGTSSTPATASRSGRTRPRTSPRRSSTRPRRRSSRSPSAASAHGFVRHPRDRQGELPHHRPALAVAGSASPACATGFVDLDDKTSGLQKSDLIILAARPAMGKTSLCLNIAPDASARRRGETVGIFSLEMSKEQLVAAHAVRARRASTRIACARAACSDEGLGAAWPRPTPTCRPAQIFIDDTAGHHAAGAARQGRRLKARARPRPDRHRLPAAR